jgi:hypothetical protein
VAHDTVLSFHHRACRYLSSMRSELEDSDAGDCIAERGLRSASSQRNGLIRRFLRGACLSPHFPPSRCRRPRSLIQQSISLLHFIFYLSSRMNRHYDRAHEKTQTGSHVSQVLILPRMLRARRSLHRVPTFPGQHSTICILSASHTSLSPTSVPPQTRRVHLSYPRHC